MKQSYYQRHKEQAKTRRKELYQLNKAKDNQRSRDYYRKNKEQLNTKKRSHLKKQKAFAQHLLKRYNLTPKQWDDFLIQQNGRCAICANILQRPHVDHCHTTGSIRGLLCSSCNRGLGYFGDDKNTLALAITYLSQGTPHVQCSGGTFP